MKLEITANVRDGVPDEVVRAVTENAKTLKFEQHLFEKELRPARRARTSPMSLSSPPDRFVSPPREELDALARPLNDGERMVFEFFDRHLPVSWEIYVEPHLNGLRPDIVLMHPRVGIAVFEVKDWNLDVCEYEIEARPGRPPVIRGRDPSGRMFTKTGRENPFAQAALYREEIARLYCPSLDHRRGIAAITAGVIFSAAADERVLDIFGDVHRHYQPGTASEYWRLAGRSTLEARDPSVVLPSVVRHSSGLMTEQIAAELRHWLVEPDVARDQRHPPKLTVSQRRHVLVREGHPLRRLKGPPGSGKSVVLSARAESLEAEGKDILVLTYNLTLPNYLRDLTSSFRHARRGSRQGRITWLTFHEWCRRHACAFGYGREYAAIWRRYFDNGERREHADSIFESEICRLVGSALSAAGHEDRFDALLIDERQDWLPEWFELVHKAALRPGGEVFFVADASQDLYDRARRWTDGVMSGAGFRGDWRRLTENHRLPHQAARLARTFAMRQLRQVDGDPDPGLEQLALDVDACTLRWVQSDRAALAETCVSEAELIMERSRNGNLAEVAAWADLFLVFDRADIALCTLERLAGKGIHAHHIFDADWRTARSKKLHFYKGDARVKAATVQSFKGWEASHIVVVLASFGPAARRNVYAGLTRLKRSDRGSHLTIVCADPMLLRVGQEWPEFHDGRRRRGELSAA